MSKQIAICIDTPALGDTLAAIPTLRKLSKAYESQLIVFSSKPFLFEGHPLVSKALKLDDPLRFDPNLKVYRTFMPIVGKAYDLKGEQVEFRSSNMDIRQFHAVSLGFTLSEDEMEMDLYIEKERELGFEDYVIIHPTHTWPTRTWDQAKWQALVDRLNAEGIPVVAVGRDSHEVGTFSVDKPVMSLDIKLGVNLLNDPTNDPAELRWMMNHRARAIVTMDSGLLHIAGTTDVNIIQLGSSIDPKLRAPYRKGTQDYKYTYVSGGCDIFCSSNMKYNIKEHGTIQAIPPQIYCLDGKPTFECHPSVDQVYDAVVDLYDVRPNIRIVHLLLEDDLTQERQTKSIQSISALKDHGIDYVQVWNKRWTETPPRETFAQPERYDEIPIKPGHYGNFRAFADATLEYFTEDLDALIYVEGDAIITTELQDLIDSINQAYQATQEHEIALFSFGSRRHLEIDSLESQTLKQLGNIHIVNKFVGAQFVMIPKQMRNFVKDRFVHHVWSTADIFLSNIFTGKFDMAIFEKPYVIQADGVSAIDGNYKTHLAEEARLETVQKHARAYITHTTENYEHVIINLVKSIRAFSDVPVLVFTVDYETSDLLKSLAECHRIDVGLPDLTDDDFHDNQLGKNMYVNRNTYRTYMALSAKIDAMIVACSLVKEWVYLDGDCLANHNVDDLFDFIEGAEYPLATRGPYEYTMSMINGVMLGNPFDDNNPGEPDNTKTLEWPLMQHFNMHSDQRSSYYKTTNILVGSEQHVEFLTEWKHLRDNLPTQVDPIVYMPFHEETIYNVMVWARTNKGLPMVYINITGPEQVEHFFGYQGEEQMFSEFYLHPGNTEGIKVFHGEKRKEQADKIVQIIKDRMRKKRLLYIAPHLSTGGMPQFVLKRVEAMLKVPYYEVHLIEYTQYSNIYNVQRDQLIEKLGKRFNSLGFLDSIDMTERGQRLRNVIEAINPDIIHIDECPESFDGFNKLEPETMDWLYNKPWKIVETSHNIWFDSANKVNDPDMYMMCTPYHLETFGERAGLKPVIEYPIIDKRPSTLDRARNRSKLGFSIDKIHVLNVGLWTQGKNQAEGINIARIVEASHPGQFQFHFVGNQAENFEHYWGPLMQDLPTNVTVWGERSDVDSFMSACDAFMFNSTWECSPLALREAIGHGLITFSRDLEQYKDMFTPYIVPFTNDLHENVDQLIKTLKSSEAQGKNIPHDDFKRFTQQHIDWYQQVLEAPRDTKTTATPKEIKWSLDWIDGPRLTIDQTASTSLRAEFWDGQDLVYAPRDLKQGHWYQPARHWWTEWTIKIWSNDQLVHSQALTLEGQTVTVEMASSSLGDTLSFMGQLHSVIDTHKLSRLYVKTHKPWLFDKAWYLERGIEIIDWSVPNKGAVMTIGVFYTMQEPWKRSEHKYDWRQIPLGKIASDRLGTEYLEQRPQLAPEFYAQAPHDARTRSVVIATQSTAQAKYWNNPTGWQEVIDWCNVNNIKVLHASKEGTKLEGIEQLPEPLETVAVAINEADCFIGISSGLSWFAWALGKKVILISGFTDPYVEFEDATYINNHQACHGCWGWSVFDKGDWNWCPAWKGTQRQFECSKTIGSDRVIEAIMKQMYG